MGSASFALEVFRENIILALVGACERARRRGFNLVVELSYD